MISFLTKGAIVLGLAVAGDVVVGQAIGRDTPVSLEAVFLAGTPLLTLAWWLQGKMKDLAQLKKDFDNFKEDFQQHAKRVQKYIDERS